MNWFRNAKNTEKISGKSNQKRWECLAITLDPEGKRFQSFLENNSHLQIKTFQGIKGSDLSKEEIISQGLVTNELAVSPLLTNGAIGCSASHKAIWDKAAEGDKGYFILEDDCYTHPGVANFIDNNLARLMNIDICFFGINTDSILQSISPIELASITLFEPKHPTQKWIRNALSKTTTEEVAIHRLIKAFGTCAYFISPSGAKTLSTQIYPLSLATTNIPLITDKMPAISIDRAGCGAYSKIEAFICQPFLAYTPNSNSTTKPSESNSDQTAKGKQAMELLNQGKLHESETIYRALITAGTTNHIDYANLGAICLIKGSLDESISLLQKALAIKPNYPEARNNMGVAFKEQGNLTAAITSYNKALELNPNYPDAHNNLGVALKEQGNLTAAINSYNKALELNPNYPDARNNLGVALHEQGEPDAAIASYNTALQLNPNYPEAHYNLGVALQKQGDLTAAVVSYNKALELNPNYPEAHINLGIIHLEQGEPDAAIACYNTALQLNPNYPEAHTYIGNSLKEQGDLTAAIAAYNKALDLKPNLPEAHNNLGVALQKQGDLAAAITSYNTALQLNPNYPEAHYNLGNILKEQGDLTAAIASYDKALDLKPNYPDAHWNSSLTMLINGDYKRGWEKYEWRSKREKEPIKPLAHPKCNTWSDEINLNQVNQLLLVAEQGIGDTLQFMRYANILKQNGIKVSFCAQVKLHSLIQASGIDPSPLTPQQADAVSEGQWIPLLSTPRRLEVSPTNPIITEPYIKTTGKLLTKWSDILSREKQPIIAINWQGNPQTEKMSLKGRSLALEAFAPITHKTNYSLLSLQKGFGSEQLQTCSFKDQFVTCQDQINDTWDFLETAAIIANCDLVITSDTSVAHLAGGMGKTTWLLLHKVPDWRWGLDGDTTFWYPSMRLFRQREQGNWNEVLGRVAESLHEHFEGSSTPTEGTTSAQPVIKPDPNQDILAPISLGELIDKRTILQIKTQHLQGLALENVKKELKVLESILSNLQINIDPSLIQRLKEVNQNLWQIEDDIRDQERQKNFGETFVQLARSVYQLNDRRAAVKKEINIRHGSTHIEEKSYQGY